MATVPIWFLNELELYQTVKPYRLDFEPEDPNLPRTNVQSIKVPSVPIFNIRDHERELQFSKCGFTILQMPSSLTTLDYNNPRLVKDIYYSYIERAVRDFHGTAKALALDHKVSRILIL